MALDVISFFSLDFVQAIGVVLISIILSKAFSSKAKLVWGSSHLHNYLLPSTAGGVGLSVKTQQIWFKNAGKQPITDLEIVLNWKPEHLEVWEPRDIQQVTLEAGRPSLKLAFLGGGEFFTLSMLETRQAFGLPSIVTVRCREGGISLVGMQPQIKYPRWIEFILRVILVVGASTILYLLVQLVIWLWPVLTSI